MIEIKNLSKTYGTGNNACQALKSVNLTIPDSSFMMVVGPSGSGKSTFLNMIGCMDMPTEGDVIFDGMSVVTRSEDQRAKFRNEKIGFVFQNFQLMPALSVYENVAMPFLVAKKKVNDKRVRELLERLEMSDKTDVLPGKLSGGQQQRSAIARALVMQPSLLLADEPTGNLDSVTSEGVMELFRAVRAADQTIVMITHNEKLTSYADHIIRMKDGVII